MDTHVRGIVVSAVLGDHRRGALCAELHPVDAGDLDERKGALVTDRADDRFGHRDVGDIECGEREPESPRREHDLFRAFHNPSSWNAHVVSRRRRREKDQNGPNLIATAKAMNAKQTSTVIACRGRVQRAHFGQLTTVSPRQIMRNGFVG